MKWAECMGILWPNYRFFTQLTSHFCRATDVDMVCECSLSPIVWCTLKVESLIPVAYVLSCFMFSLSLSLSLVLPPVPFFLPSFPLPPPSLSPTSPVASCLSYVPDKGTVGASGDLAPLSHLALGMMGEGRMWSPESGWGQAKDVLESHWLKPITLKAKEVCCWKISPLITIHHYITDSHPKCTPGFRWFHRLYSVCV